MRDDNGRRHGVWTGRPTGNWTLCGEGGADGDCRCSGRRIRPGVLPEFRLDASKTLTLSATRLPRRRALGVPTCRLMRPAGDGAEGAPSGSSRPDHLHQSVASDATNSLLLPAPEPVDRASGMIQHHGRHVVVLPLSLANPVDDRPDDLLNCCGGSPTPSRSVGSHRWTSSI